MNREPEEGKNLELQGERLARFLAHAGIASRRHAEELIASGRVRVNEVVVTTQGTRIDPLRDTITVDGKPVTAPTQYVYVLLHKPVGYLTTASDPQGRPTVMDLLPEKLRRLRVYPVGRLDTDTSGLLLLTNDGEFALHITHPRYSLEKYYHALVQGCPTVREVAMLRSGVEFTEDNGQHHTSAPAKVRILRQEGANCWLSLVIHEGRKRQVRRMLFAVGHRVLELKRVGIGSLELGNLPLGKWRYLSDEEVKRLL
jgi:23S rRNA pseudouridine2605 synthase